MPDFTNPYSVLSLGRKMTRAELIRAVRFSIAAEYEAVQIYMQIAEASDNPLVAEVMRDVAAEEIVHAGEFLRILYEIAPEEARLYEEGYQEVEEIIKKYRAK
ncbi:MAG: rubrerythrin [Firmicutes bacterium]|nr:rubrerythrin [Bacillota bacterium]